MKSTALSLVRTLEKEHRRAFEQTEMLADTLTRLKYEGKPSFGRNLKEARTIAEYFETNLLRHMRFEEETVFPFLKKHIPKLEPAIDYLSDEHSDFQEKLTVFSNAIKNPPEKSSSPDTWQWLEKTIEAGTYLVYLFRQHTQAERKSLYEAIESILNENEKKNLQGLIRQHRRKLAATSGEAV